LPKGEVVIAMHVCWIDIWLLSTKS